MAVIEGVPGLEVQIVVAGVPLQEYNSDEDDEVKSVTKYIEATSGANFEIRWSFTSDFKQKGHQILIAVYGDGMGLAAETSRPSDLLTGYSTLTGGTRNAGNHAVFEKFTFSELKIDEDKIPLASSAATISSLGVISVKLRRVKVLKNAGRPQTEKFKSLGTVPEKALKGRALSHSIRLGRPELVPTVTWQNIEYIGKGPLAEFHFKYRSLKALKDLCLIPRSPSPVPLEDRALETLTPEELLDVARKLKEQTVRNAVRIKKERRLKRERSDADDDDEEHLTITDSRSRKSARRSNESAEVVDLT